MKTLARQSAGILCYKWIDYQLHVLLVHPGGPFYARKDEGIWSIPKGEFAAGEDMLSAAKREYEEELGQPLLATNFIQLLPVKQKGGKTVYAWACEGDLDTSCIKSNTFPMQWPPRSGKWMEVPEIDRAEWFDVHTAALKINGAQASLLSQLQSILMTSGE